MTDTVNVPREAVEMANARYPNAGISGGFVNTLLHHKRTSFIAGYEAAMLAAAPKAEPVEWQSGPNSPPYPKGSVVQYLGRHFKAVIDIRAGGYSSDPIYSRFWELLPPQPLSNPQQLPEAPKVEQEPCDSHKALGFHYDPCCPHCPADPEADWNARSHPAPASDELLEALAPLARYYDLNDCHERRPDDALEVPIYDLARAAELYAKHKGPQS